LDGGYHEIGIAGAVSNSNLTIASCTVENMNWATRKKDVSISIKILNKGNIDGQGVTAKLLATNKGIIVKNGETSFGSIPVNEAKAADQPFVFNVQTDSVVDMIRLKLIISDRSNREWVEFLDIPIKTDQPEISNFEVADGRSFTVATAGDDTTTVFLGKGNGDGIANPGESVVILVKDQGIYQRTFLYTPDKYVNPNGINIRSSDNWGAYDHVGGSAKYSIPVLASNCPENHTIELFAEYWLPDYPYHIIKQGTIKLRVSGKDETSPKVLWVQVSGNNTIQARIHDGGKTQTVSATLKEKGNPDKSFEVILNDLGENGDVSANDRVFSIKIPEQLFGLYQVEIIATDSFGNKMSTNWPDSFVLY